MRIFKTKWFQRWARKQHLKDTALCNAIAEVAQGLVDADLGGHVFKKRVAIQGRGKSGGLRTLIAYRQGNRAFFVYGFPKNQRANISEDELEALRTLSDELMGYGNQRLQTASEAGELIEVTCHE